MHPNDWFWFYVLMVLVTAYNGGKVIADSWVGTGWKVLMGFLIVLQVFFMFAFGVEYS